MDKKKKRRKKSIDQQGRQLWSTYVPKGRRLGKNEDFWASYAALKKKAQKNKLSPVIVSTQAPVNTIAQIHKPNIFNAILKISDQKKIQYAIYLVGYVMTSVILRGLLTGAVVGILAVLTMWSGVTWEEALRASLLLIGSVFSVISIYFTAKGLQAGVKRFFMSVQLQRHALFIDYGNHKIEEIPFWEIEEVKIYFLDLHIYYNHWGSPTRKCLKIPYVFDNFDELKTYLKNKTWLTDSNNLQP